MSGSETRHKDGSVTVVLDDAEATSPSHRASGHSNAAIDAAAATYVELKRVEQELALVRRRP
jgi:hypothetical protein